jgi:hypothetical protein
MDVKRCGCGCCDESVRGYDRFLLPWRTFLVLLSELCVPIELTFESLGASKLNFNETDLFFLQVYYIEIENIFAINLRARPTCHTLSAELRPPIAVRSSPYIEKRVVEVWKRQSQILGLIVCYSCSRHKPLATQLREIKHCVAPELAYTHNVVA